MNYQQYQQDVGTQLHVGSNTNKIIQMKSVKHPPPIFENVEPLTAGHRGAHTLGTY